MAGTDHTHHDHDATARTTDGATASRGATLDSVAAQRARFGGIKWGSAFFG